MKCLTALGSGCPRGDSYNAGGRSKPQQVKRSPVIMVLFSLTWEAASSKRILKNLEKKCRTSSNVSPAAGLRGHKSPADVDPTQQMEWQTPLLCWAPHKGHRQYSEVNLIPFFPPLGLAAPLQRVNGVPWVGCLLLDEVVMKGMGRG